MGKLCVGKVRGNVRRGLGCEKVWGEVSGECGVCGKVLGEVWQSVGRSMKKCGGGVEAIMINLEL